MTFRDHPYTHLIVWNTVPWSKADGDPLPDMDAAVLISASERSEGLAVVAEVGARRLNAVIPNEDPFFHEYLAPWLQARVGMRLKELYDEEIDYPPNP